MRTIKTRETRRDIKVLDKSVDLSKRMKDTFVRTKERAEGRREPGGSSPTDYAIDSIQEKSKDSVDLAINRLPNPRKKAAENIERAKGFFQDAKRQLPTGRNRAAEQSQIVSNKAKGNADNLRKTADQAKKTANDMKTEVKDAKRTLKQVRHDGRRSVREVKQRTRLENRRTVSNKPQSVSSGKAPEAPIIDIPTVGTSQPNYLSKGVRMPGKTNNAEIAKTIKSKARSIKKTGKGTVKTVKKSVKTAERSAKTAIKTAQRSAKAAQKTAQAAAKAAKAAEKAARAAAKAAAKTAKVVIKVVIALVKAAIAAVKGLVTAIAAGGWVAVVIILVICLIALIVGSVFGVFFSGEPDAGTGQTINGVISEIDAEYTALIDSIRYAVPYDHLDMSGARAAWKQVLAVYTVRTVSDPDNPMEVATMNDVKAAILRSVFWEMNNVSYTYDVTEIEEDVLDENGLPTGETTTTTYTVLRIIVTNKKADEMALKYGFSAEQKESLEELLKPEYHSLWNSLLYGITTIGDGSMIEVAITQLGNIGGEPYWRWYGFSDYVAWCACFVSWCANECGYIGSGVFPLFSWCPAGVEMFKQRGQWQDNTYIPAPGNIVFFDWQPDGEPDHVGIVESVVNGVVNTLEGNASDSVMRRSYEIGSVKIYGYGIPEY